MFFDGADGLLNLRMAYGRWEMGLDVLAAFFLWFDSFFFVESD